MIKCQKDPTTCGIFLKWGLFKDIKNDIAMCQTPKYKNTNLEYTNTAFAEMPEGSIMWYIFEKRIGQGYLLSLAQLYKVLFKMVLIKLNIDSATKAYSSTIWVLGSDPQQFTRSSHSQCVTSRCAKGVTWSVSHLEPANLFCLMFFKSLVFS